MRSADLAPLGNALEDEVDDDKDDVILQTCVECDYCAIAIQSGYA